LNGNFKNASAVHKVLATGLKKHGKLALIHIKNADIFSNQTSGSHSFKTEFNSHIGVMLDAGSVNPPNWSTPVGRADVLKLMVRALRVKAHAEAGNRPRGRKQRAMLEIANHPHFNDVLIKLSKRVTKDVNEGRTEYDPMFGMIPETYKKQLPEEFALMISPEGRVDVPPSSEGPLVPPDNYRDTRNNLYEEAGGHDKAHKFNPTDSVAFRIEHLGREARRNEILYGTELVIGEAWAQDGHNAVIKPDGTVVRREMTSPEGRIYFAVRSEYAQNFWRALSELRHVEYGDLHLVFKQAKHVERYESGDTAVLYFEAHDSAKVYQLVRKLHSQNPHFFRSVKPVFAAELRDPNGQWMEGISFGQSPVEAKSFNGKIADIYTEARRGVHYQEYLRRIQGKKPRTKEELEKETRRAAAYALEKAGIPLESPAFQSKAGIEAFRFIYERTDQYVDLTAKAEQLGGQLRNVKIDKFVEDFTAPYELPEHGISVPARDKGDVYKLIDSMGHEKFSALLKSAKENVKSYEIFTSMLNMALSSESNSVRTFLKKGSRSQIELLIMFKGSGNIVSGLRNDGYLKFLTGDPAELVAEAKKIENPEVRNLITALQAMREFQLRKANPGRKNPMGLALLHGFGIDPSTHKNFPWTSSDALHRASVFYRVASAKKTFLKVFTDAVGHDKARNVRDLVDTIWQLVTIQDVKDTHLPFTPHGWQHSLDVVNIMNQVFNGSKSLQTSMIAKYGSKQKAQAVLFLIGILHDIGYGRLKKGEKKSKHAELSGKIFRAELKDQVKRLFELTDGQINDIALAIERHGAYYPEKSNYMPASETQNPELFAVRAGDNFNAASERLRAIQKNPLFLKAMKEMNDLPHKNPELKNDPEALKTALDKIKAKYSREIRKNTSPEDAKLLIDLLSNMNETSYPHFKGCEKLARLSFQEVNGQLVVTVEIIGKADSGKVIEKTSGGELQIDAALFQLWRAHTAAKSLTLNGKPIRFQYDQVYEWGDIDGIQRRERITSRRKFSETDLKPQKDADDSAPGASNQ
jgi:HD superfamily phosphodiesterase